MNGDFEALSNKWFGKYFKNIRIVILLVLTIIAVGVTSLATLQRRLNPQIKLTIVSVITVLPGAGPADTESLLTVPLEDKLLGVKGIDTITSSSRENVSSIVMQFVSGVDNDQARNDVQTAVNNVTTLPSDAQTPIVSALDFEDTPIWNFTVTSNKGDLPSLMRYADSLRERIEDIPNVDRVNLTGFDTQQIQVKVLPEKLSELRISPFQLAGMVKNATVAFPAGNVSTDSSDFSLSIDKEVNSIDDIRNLILNIKDQPIRFGDVAQINFISQPDLKKTFLVTKDGNIKQAVSFFVYKSSSADITKTVKQVEEMVHKDIEGQGDRYTLNTIINTGEEINKQFSDVLSEFRSTLILVFINLLLFLGLRQALIASITIPLTFLMAFGWMSALGQTINFISLFALLLAFGTSIDDTIVTVSAMTTYNKSRELTPYQAGLLVWRDFVVPIWTTTITTVWAFLPLILTSGIIGEFIKPIPVTVATTMYSSTAVAWFITLPLMIVLLNPRIPSRVKTLFKTLLVIISVILIVSLSPKNVFLLPTVISFIILLVITFKLRSGLIEILKAKFTNFRYTNKVKRFFTSFLSEGFINLEPLQNMYKNLISRIIDSRRGRRAVLICIVIYAVGAFSLLPAGLVKNEFFPKSDGDNIYVNVELPSGTTTKLAEVEAEQVLKQLQNTEEAISIIAEPGKQLDSMGNMDNSNNSILFSITLTPMEERKISSVEIAESIRKKFANYSKGKFSVIEQGGGPPAGADVQITFLGEGLDQLDQYANKTTEFLSKQQGIINVDKSIKSGTSKLTFVPDKVKMSQTGVTADTLGFWLRTYASGFNLDTIRLDGKDTDIVFFTDSGDLKPEDLGKINIPTNNGDKPLLSLGSLELRNNPTIITHEEGKRSITIAAGVQQGYSISDANKNLINFAQTQLNMEQGYEWKTGGVNEENNKSVQSIFRAMGLSFILIMATMVIEFGSFRQAAMILSLIPFAVSGVFYVFGLTGTPLSFPALIGVMALFGVVVTNAMFIVEKINQNRAAGMPLNEALADAGQSRLEPIILTSLTSILGLIPITLANALWRGLGGAIISGLMFAGVIMLFYIPTVYKTIYAEKE